MRRLKFFLKQRGWQTAAVVGVALIVVGVLLARDYPLHGAVLTSTGSSVLATFIVTLLSRASDERYHRFLRLGITDVYPSRKAYPSERWVQWLCEAKQSCILFGVAHEKWCEDPDFKNALGDRLRAGVEVKVFFLDPTSNLAVIRASEEGRRTPEIIRSSIKCMWDQRNDLDSEAKNRFRLYVYDATPSSGATWVDCVMLVTHYLGGTANRTSPCLMIKSVGSEVGTTDLYGVYAENIKYIEKKSVKIDEANVATYI